MRRVFTGLPIPADICRQLSRMQGGIAGARWTSVADLHLTLSFIGEVDNAQLEELDAALQDVFAPAFDFCLAGTGSFAQGKWPNVLWMGVDAPPDLLQLKQQIDGALRAADIPHETRKYAPHVTMARLRHAEPDEVARFMQAHNLYRSAMMRADHFILYESAGSGEQHYVPVAEYPLMGV